MQLSLAFLIVAVFKRNSGEFPRFLEHLTGELRSWTKVLGQTYICGAFHTRQTNSSTLVQPLPLPPSYNVGHVYTLFLQSFNIVLGGEGGGGEQRILKRITVLF